MEKNWAERDREIKRKREGEKETKTRRNIIHSKQKLDKSNINNAKFGISTLHTP